MTSQPLETITEEPTPTPAPARVTADPPKTKPAKNPGRVASGKRLAERNRLAREAQKKARRNQHQHQHRHRPTAEEWRAALHWRQHPGPWVYRLSILVKVCYTGTH